MWENAKGKGQEHLRLQCSKVIAKSDVTIFHKFILKGNFKFSIKLDQISIFFSIGIASRAKNWSKVKKSKWVHYNSDGELWMNNKFMKRSQELKSGDIITICGNLKDCFLEFAVNNKTVTCIKCLQLCEQDLEWRANIKLCKNNCISLNEYFNELDMVAVFLSETWFSWDEDILNELNLLIHLV